MSSLLNHVIVKLGLTDIHRLLNETTIEPAPKFVTYKQFREREGERERKREIKVRDKMGIMNPEAY